MSTVYARYQRWCDELLPKVQPYSATEFAEQFKTVRQRVALRVRADKNGKVHCLDVRLAA